MDVRWDRLQNLLDPSQAAIEFYESVFHLRAGQHRRSSNEFADPRGRWILGIVPTRQGECPNLLHTGIARGDATGSATLTADATTTASVARQRGRAGDGGGDRCVRRFNHRWRRRDARQQSGVAVVARGKAGDGTRRPAIAVVNAGLSGNRLLRPGFGVSALARFDRDVLTHAGVRWMTVLLGIKDITFPAVPGAAPAEAVTADDLIGISTDHRARPCLASR